MVKKEFACLDTSVLLRLLVGEPEIHGEKNSALDSIINSGGKIIISDLVLCETYIALQYHYKIPKKNAIATLKNLAESAEVECSPTARAVLEHPNLHSTNPGFADRIIHAQYDSTGHTMLTFEKAAKKLENVPCFEILLWQ